MKLATIIHFAQPAFTIHEQPEQLPELGCAGLRWVALGCAGRPGTFSGLRWVALGRAELGCAQLGATSAAILVGSIAGGAPKRMFEVDQDPDAKPEGAKPPKLRQANLTDPDASTCDPRMT